MRIALAVLMVLHGIAHLPGFLVPWRLIQSPDLPYATTILGGRLDLGGGGIRALGAVWLATALAFCLAGAAAGAARPGWTTAALAVTTFSLALTLAQMPVTRIGLGVNLALLAALLAAPRFGAL